FLRTLFGLSVPRPAETYSPSASARISACTRAYWSIRYLRSTPFRVKSSGLDQTLLRTQLGDGKLDVANTSSSACDLRSASLAEPCRLAWSISCWMRFGLSWTCSCPPLILTIVPGTAGKRELSP